MRKVITYPIFVTAFILVALLFITSKDYTQLGLAVVLYPLLAYLALNLFPRRAIKEHEVTIQSPIKVAEKVVQQEVLVDEAKEGGISDTDKRAFLKLIGAAGISVFLFSLFSKKAQIPFFGKIAGNSDSIALKDTQGKAIDPAENQPFDGFQIAEIEDSLIAYYGFINKDGAWYIMRGDAESNSFRFAKGSSGFPNGWANRARLKYDYFYNV